MLPALVVPSQSLGERARRPLGSTRKRGGGRQKPQWRANPYPVVVPILDTSTSTRAVTVAYTYPDLSTPSPASSSLRNSADLDSDAGATHASVLDGHGDTVPRPACGPLRADVNVDMGAACAGGAGFLRHCPPLHGAVAQERIPIGHRPRESPGLARTLHQAVLGTKEGNDVEDVENESEEVELMYPEDVPVATRCAFAASESNSGEFKPAEDDNDELELVYPEDAAETAQTPSTKLQAKPPTTLRELFTGGLQPILTLQDPAALADKSPLRRCLMPGCNEVLRPQTCLKRCLECSVDDWKRRKLASMGASDPPPFPSASSPMTNTSTEEKQATTALDGISQVEDENKLPSPSSSPSKSTGNEPTDGHGAGPTPGWDSDLTELLSTDVESESVSGSDSDSEPGPGAPTSHGDTSHLMIRIPLLVNQLPSYSSRRKCGNKKCNIALPEDHRWKTCGPCRQAQRMYQRVRLENIRRNINGIGMLESLEHLHRRWRSLSPETPEMDTTLTPETSRPCSVKHCQRRIPLPEVYRWKMCVWCRAQARHHARRKRDARIEEQHASRQPEVVPHFPAYQNRGALQSSLDAQLKAFVEGQIMYMRAKLHEGETLNQAGNDLQQPRHVQMIFLFVGEYSIVAGSRGDGDDCGGVVSPNDGPAALNAMREEVSSIILDLERALRTRFSVREASAIDKGGLITQSTCSLELIAQLRPLTTRVGSGHDPRASMGSGDDGMDRDKDESSEGEALVVKPPPKPPAVPLVKILSGELEVAVVPEESHRLFHGRRTVIRYCMLG